ncbi:hypothetical protein Tco_0651556 [Tanacetum coccineum]|uniref:Uncharacterized protein n=1 Tax=Tanacetum coccineum TaxID=301880 RepID=A0ABQ4WV54_9ASTR
METIDIEYEWQPPRCDTCKICYHIDDQCPKKVKVDAPTQESDDGFCVVSNRVNVNDEASTSQPKENKEASSQPKSNVNGKASTSQPKENKEAASQSNAFSALEEDNGNPMDDLVYETRKKVEAPPKKTPRKTGIWSGRKADSPKRNVVFSPETKVHYFDRDDMEFDDMGRRPRDGSMRMPTTIMVDGFLMVISISYQLIYVPVQDSSRPISGCRMSHRPIIRGMCLDLGVSLVTRALGNPLVKTSAACNLDEMKIGRTSYGRFIITLDGNRCKASVDDLETTNCFFDDQEIKHEPRITAEPLIDLLVIGQEAQSL